MSDKNIEKKQHAQLLYITQGKSHAEIAEEVGVTERTVFNWVHQYAWDKLRLASYQAPVTIADRLCSEIVELQETIALRDVGKRFPTPQESMTMQRMVSCLEKMKKYPSLSQNMQMLESFKNYVKPINKEFAKSLRYYTELYLESSARNGFAPYQVEYGVDAAPPLAPYYDEEETVTESATQEDYPLRNIAAYYTIPDIHHARPYLMPLMNICREQLVEELQRDYEDANVVKNFIDQRYGENNAHPEISGNDPETTTIENNTKQIAASTENIPSTAIPLPAPSGNNPEITETLNSATPNTISEIKPIILISGSDKTSGSNPEIFGTLNNTFSSKSFNQENQGSDEPSGNNPEISGQSFNQENQGSDDTEALEKWRAFNLSIDDEDSILKKAS